MNKQLRQKITAKCDMYIRVSTAVPDCVEFYSPFYIDGTEIIGASSGDVFEVIEENDEGVMLSDRKQNKIWISRQLLWRFYSD